MSSESYKKLWGQIGELIRLYLVNVRLSVAEKVVRLLSVLAICTLLLILAIIAFFFITLAVIHWISLGVGIEWAYMIMGGFYLVLGIVIVVFRYPLLLNPLARFITRLLFS